MLLKVEPFRTFLKAFQLFGFDFAKASKLHKCLVVLVLTTVTIYWLLAFSALLQSGSVDELTDRLLYLPTVLGVILKAANLLHKFELFKALMEEFAESYDDQKFDKYLSKAARKSLLMAKIQFVSYTIMNAVSIVLSFVIRKLTVPMFVIQVEGWQETLFWSYKFLHDAGTTYGCYMLVVVDLMPISLMLVIAEYFRYINDNICDLRNCSSDAQMQNEFVKLLKLHREQKK